MQKKNLTPPANIIIHGDALDLLRHVPDNSVDLVVCDGPYGMAKDEWDKTPGGVQNFNLKLIGMFSQKMKLGGALYLFGKQDCVDFVDYRPYLSLKRKIIWYQPGRLSQGRINYTNNYDLICYFVKNKKPKTFNLDDIRVPQLVELDQRRRCENVPSVKNGKYRKTKFCPNGKNPGDVWGDIKQLTYKSKELVDRSALNTIQKPEKLMERIILASTKKGDMVLDPFAGTGTCPAVCLKLRRRFIAFEINRRLVNRANKRIEILRPQPEGGRGDV
ncbi:MAG: DNA-methyltransferase [Gammaproteobacteria bacterium]